jgi:hypothetical protein
LHNNDLHSTAKTIRPYNTENAHILDSAITKQYNNQPLNDKNIINAFDFEPKPRKSLSQNRAEILNESPKGYQEKNSNGDSNKKSGSGESKASEKNVT